MRQRPLSASEAERLIRRRTDTFAACYRRERLNTLGPLSSFLFRVWIPTDGSGADVEMEKETVQGQLTLRECLEDELGRVRFPAHNGEPLTIRVPLKGPA